MKYSHIFICFLLLLIIGINDAICIENADLAHEYLEIYENTNFNNLQHNSIKFKMLSERPDWKHFARMIMISQQLNWSVSLYQSSGDNDHKWNIHYIILTNIETRTNDQKWIINYKIDRKEDLSFPSDTGQNVYAIFTNMVTKAKKRQPGYKRHMVLDGGDTTFTIDSGTNELHGSIYEPDLGLTERLIELGCLLFKYGVSVEDIKKECIKEIYQKTKEFYSKKLWKLEVIPIEISDKIIWKNDVPYRQTTNELYEP